MSFSSLLIMLTAPAIGAWSDQHLAKKKMMADLDKKMAGYGDKAAMIKRIEELEKENAELREKLKNGGASEEELKAALAERDKLRKELAA